MIAINQIFFVREELWNYSMNPFSRVILVIQWAMTDGFTVHHCGKYMMLCLENIFYSGKVNLQLADF